MIELKRADRFIDFAKSIMLLPKSYETDTSESSDYKEAFGLWIETIFIPTASLIFQIHPSVVNDVIERTKILCVRYTSYSHPGAARSRKKAREESEWKILDAIENNIQQEKNPLIHQTATESVAVPSDEKSQNIRDNVADDNSNLETGQRAVIDLPPSPEPSLSLPAKPPIHSFSTRDTSHNESSDGDGNRHTRDDDGDIGPTIASQPSEKSQVAMTDEQQRIPPGDMFIELEEVCSRYKRLKTQGTLQTTRRHNLINLIGLSQVAAMVVCNLTHVLDEIEVASKNSTQPQQILHNGTKRKNIYGSEKQSEKSPRIVSPVPSTK
jgi:hypothetical protein